MFPTKYYVTNTLMMVVVMLIMFGKTDNHLMSVGRDHSRVYLLLAGRLRLYELTFILTDFSTVAY